MSRILMLFQCYLRLQKGLLGNVRLYPESVVRVSTVSVTRDKLELTITVFPFVYITLPSFVPLSLVAEPLVVCGLQA
jgi:hypothetical protein